MYSKGVSWIDDCRIPHNEDLSIVREEKKLDIQNQGWGFKSVSRDNSGRFPANILVSDDMLNDGGSSSRYYCLDKWFEKLLNV
jgi:hypothetical protein